MPAAKKWREPNKDNPLAEPTLNRRLWAAYLALGWTRADFARRMEVGYNLATGWDHGTHGISLAHLIKASELVGYTLDELVFGVSSERRKSGGEASLNRDQLVALLDELRANADQCRAISEHLESSSGRLQRCTRTYVSTFVSAYADARRANKSHVDAKRAAATLAGEARDRVDALDAGRRPLDPDVLRAAYAENLQAAKPKKRKPRKQPPRVPVTKPTEH